MTIELLYPRVTEAIERAERLEDENKEADAQAAYLDVSMLEEEIASELSASDAEGMLARRGAVRASVRAGVLARAKDLAERYLMEAGAPETLLEELRALAAEADAGLDLPAIEKLRVVPEARYRFHHAA